MDVPNVSSRFMRIGSEREQRALKMLEALSEWWSQRDLFLLVFKMNGGRSSKLQEKQH